MDNERKDEIALYYSVLKSTGKILGLAVSTQSEKPLPVAYVDNEKESFVIRYHDESNRAKGLVIREFIEKIIAKKRELIDHQKKVDERESKLNQLIRPVNALDRSYLDNRVLDPNEFNQRIQSAINSLSSSNRRDLIYQKACILLKSKIGHIGI